MSEESKVIDVNSEGSTDTTNVEVPDSIENIDISAEDSGESSESTKEEGIDYGVLDSQENEDQAEESVNKHPRNKLERLMRKKEKELERERMEKEMLKQKIMEQSNQAVVSQPPETFGIIPPRRDDFVDEDDYIDARMEYKLQMQGLKYRKQQIEASQIKKHEETVKSYETMMDRGSDKYEDFESVTYDLLHGNFPANQAMAEALFDSEYSDDIAYVLGNNIEEARKIALLPPIKAVKKLAEIESKIKALKGSKKPSQKPKIIEPLKGGHKPGAVSNKRLEDYSAAEIDKMSVREMNELEKARGRRPY